MSVLTPESAVPRRTRATSLAGYRVLGPEGWIGTVTDAYGDEYLGVRTGLFRQRWLVVPAAGIDRVDTARRSLTLRHDPRDSGGGFTGDDASGR